LGDYRGFRFLGYIKKYGVAFYTAGKNHFSLII
jgi:hypothetical protein